MPSLKTCASVHWELWLCIIVSHAEASGICANLERDNVLTGPTRYTANRLSRHLISGQEQVKHTVIADGEGPEK